MPNEVELKFDLDPDDVALVREAPALASTACESCDHETVYFDTAGRALRAAGFSLRVRRTGDRFVQTMKRRNGGSVGLFVRDEWEDEVPECAPVLDRLKAAAVKRVLARIGTDPLLPLIRTLFSRTRWTVDFRGSCIEIVLDEGRVVSGDSEAPICELELELIHGKPRALFRLAKEIGATVPLRLGVLSKVERGYALTEDLLGAAAGAVPVQLSPEIDQRTAFRAVANACLRQFRLNEIALLSGRRDAESLHHGRVALRRLRSAFVLFRPILVGKEFRHLREDLRWLAGQLGEARDLDVLIARSARATADLRRRRDKAYAKVEATLRAPRARALLLRLAAWIEGGNWRHRDAADDPVGPFAQHRLDRLWEKVARRGSKLAELDADSRHKLRIDAKKLRYSAEFLSGLHANRKARARRDRFVAALKTLQDCLGDINDARLGLAGRSADGGADPSDTELLPARQAFDRAEAAAGYWRS